MKKLIAVSASLLLTASAISVNADSIKQNEKQFSDILACVKENYGKEGCNVSGILSDILKDKFECDSIDSLISDLADKLTQLLPGNGVQKPEEEKPETDVPETDIPENNVPEIEIPEVDIPEVDIPDTETPDTQKPDTDGGYESNDSYVNEVLNLVNRYRNENGLPSVTLDKELCEAANIRAKEIKTSFSHTRPDGSSCFTVLSQLGISYGGAGENIAYGQSSAEEVMTAWMNSSGHRANILSSSYTKLGVGVYSSGGVLYWAQMFTY